MVSEEGRWTRPEGGRSDDHRDPDERRPDPQHVRVETETRPVVNDQKPTGAPGISSDPPGVDPGTYTETEAEEHNDSDD